jgi:DNA-binding NarL/FixJ family response regulator
VSSGQTLKIGSGSTLFSFSSGGETIPRMRRIFIVDDNAGFRSFARQLLTAEGYDVVGEAADGSSVVAAARELRPDLVLLDIRLPDIDGFEVATRLAAEPDPPAVVLISSRDAADYGPRLKAPGVRAFLAKAELSRASIDALFH